MTQPPSAADAPGRQWQQLISAGPSVKLSIDMRQAQLLPPARAPAPTTAPAGPQPTEPAPVPSSPTSPRCCTELEEHSERSLPAYQALGFPPPTCPALPPAARPSATLLATTQPAPTRPSLLHGLAAACAVQVVAITMLLARRSGGHSGITAAASGGHQTAEEAAAPVRRQPALIDACTSPLALLTSPFVRGRRQAVEELEPIPEEQPAAEKPLVAEPPAQQASPGPQQASPGLQQAGTYGGLPPAPAGWTRWVLGKGGGSCSERCLLGSLQMAAPSTQTPADLGQHPPSGQHPVQAALPLPLRRDAWGRLQRLSGGGGGAWGGKPAVQHPPPFGFGGPTGAAFVTPGTAYRPFGGRQYSEE